MAATREELLSWLADVAEDALIGIDEGGLTLVEIDAGNSFEIGGIPEDEDRYTETGPFGYESGVPDDVPREAQGGVYFVRKYPDGSTRRIYSNGRHTHTGRLIQPGKRRRPK